MTTKQDRIKGVLLGQAAGDALGSHYEFGKPSNGKARMLRGTFGHEPGEWTDDTQQAVVVVTARSEPAAVAAGLLAWYAGRPKDVGIATAAVLSASSRAGAGSMAEISRRFAKQDAATPRPLSWDPGGANGSLMRTGPVCLPFLGDREQIAKVAREVSDLTHADPYCGDACVLWSLAIDAAIEGGEWSSRSLMLDGLDFIPAERRDYWYKQIRLAMTTDPGEFRQNGSAAGCFRAALSAVSHATSLRDGLQKAVAVGNDTDTVAAVAGALLGAIYGASAVPESWRRKLHGWPGGKVAADLEQLALSAAGGE